jgi:MFS family permease
MSAQVFVFGIMAIMQIFVTNRRGFLAMRAFLGLAEAGYIPGAIYTLSTWYRRRELARRVAILFFGMFGGNALSPLLASGILKLDTQRGLKGWQWIFLCSCRPSLPSTSFLALLIANVCSGGPLHHPRSAAHGASAPWLPRGANAAVLPRHRAHVVRRRAAAPETHRRRLTHARVQGATRPHHAPEGVENREALAALAAFPCGLTCLLELEPVDHVHADHHRV